MIGCFISVLLMMTAFSGPSLAESYAHTIDKHPICKGRKIVGKCSSDFNAVGCSYQEWDEYENEWVKLYSICRFERYSGEIYQWYHINYVPWRP